MTDVHDRIEELREHIQNIQDSLAQWEDSGFPRKTILVLLNHKTKIPMSTINTILNGMMELNDYLYKDVAD